MMNEVIHWRHWLDGPMGPMFSLVTLLGKDQLTFGGKSGPLHYRFRATTEGDGQREVWSICNKINFDSSLEAKYENRIVDWTVVPGYRKFFTGPPLCKIGDYP